MRQVSRAVDDARRREINMTEFDPRRFGKFADETYVRDQVFQDYRLTFPTRKPGEGKMGPTPKKGRCTKAQAQGCVYTRHSAGNAEVVLPRWPQRGLLLCAQQTFSRSSREEVAAVHERVGILDLDQDF